MCPHVTSNTLPYRKGLPGMLFFALSYYRIVIRLHYVTLFFFCTYYRNTSALVHLS